MLIDRANGKTGGCQFSRGRQTGHTAADDENVEDLYVAMMPQAAWTGGVSRPRLSIDSFSGYFGPAIFQAGLLSRAGFST